MGGGARAGRPSGFGQGRRARAQAYKFGDFFKVGVALQLVILVATLVVVPLLFPFEALAP